MGMGGEAEIRAHARVGALDGLRGLAVAAVLLYHSQYGFARGGFLGVSAFFTLSGFLITSLLLTQRERGVPLRRFWGRRARRLLPAAMLALAGVLIFGATIATDDQLRLLRGDVFATLTYVANWRFYASGQSYAHLFSAPSPVLHFWSLAIEEQFYVVFPLVVALVAWLTRRTSSVRRRQVLGALLATGIVASVVASRMLYATERIDPRLLRHRHARRGAARGRAARRHPRGQHHDQPARDATRPRPAPRSAASVALGVMVWWWATVEQSASWLYHGGFALHACLAAIVIAAARVEGPFARGLAWRPLAALGLISYGVYLYHWPIYLWLTPARTGPAGRAPPPAAGHAHDHARDRVVPVRGAADPARRAVDADPAATRADTRVVGAARHPAHRGRARDRARARHRVGARADDRVRAVERAGAACCRRSRRRSGRRTAAPAREEADVPPLRRAPAAPHPRRRRLGRADPRPRHRAVGEPDRRRDGGERRDPVLQPRSCAPSASCRSGRSSIRPPTAPTGPTSGRRRSTPSIPTSSSCSTACGRARPASSPTASSSARANPALDRWQLGEYQAAADVLSARRRARPLARRGVRGPCGRPPGAVLGDRLPDDSQPREVPARRCTPST